MVAALLVLGVAASLWFWREASTAAVNEGIARAEAVASAQEAQKNERVAVEQTEVAKRELARAVEIKRLDHRDAGERHTEAGQGR